MRALIICIGNKSRGDDGAARRVAELLEPSVHMGTVVLSEPQLDITMAEDVATADIVIFVDAERRESPPVAQSRIAASDAPAHAHALSPGGLLALAKTLFGRDREAVLVTVAAPVMDHRVGLSATSEAASVEAASEVMRLLSSANPSEG